MKWYMDDVIILSDSVAPCAGAWVEIASAGVFALNLNCRPLCGGVG